MTIRRTVAVVALAVLAIDAVSKALAAQLLAGHGAVPVAGGVHLLLYRNHAGPGNLLTGHPVLVSLFVLVAVAAMLWTVRVVQTRLGAVALGLMLGGGLGNLADRLLRGPGPLRGGVVDWIQLHPGGGSMNLADVSLNLAVAVALLALAVGARQAAGSRADVDADAPRAS